MRIIENIVSSIIPKTIDPNTAHDPKSTVSAIMSSADHSAYLKGLNKVQENFFLCKYVGDAGSCKKGLSAYRAHIYRNSDLMCWLKLCKSPDRLSQKSQEIITDRMSTSPMMSWLAFNELVKSQRCETCFGAGTFENVSVKIECEDCKGTGYLNKELSAQQRAIYLHVGTSTYWKKFDQVFHRYYRSPLVDIETKTLMKIIDNVNGKKKGADAP